MLTIYGIFITGLVIWTLWIGTATLLALGFSTTGATINASLDPTQFVNGIITGNWLGLLVVALSWAIFGLIAILIVPYTSNIGGSGGKKMFLTARIIKITLGIGRALGRSISQKATTFYSKGVIAI